MTEELDVLKEAVKRLNEAQIPYLISGSVAMNFYAEPRMTRDIDIVIELHKADVKRFVKHFEHDFYVDEEVVEAEVEMKRMFNLIHNQYIIKIDFIMHKGDELSVSAFGRGRTVDVDDVALRIISPEDLILYKLIWAKESMSEMQLRDVQNIVNIVKDIDWNYVVIWAKKLKLENVLDKVNK